MDLEEGLLEDVLRGLPISRQPDQEPQQVILVPSDEHAEGLGVAVPVILQEFFVGAL
jgi:hypothetical protein